MNLLLLTVVPVRYGQLKTQRIHKFLRQATELLECLLAQREALHFMQAQHFSLLSVSAKWQSVFRNELPPSIGMQQIALCSC